LKLSRITIAASISADDKGEAPQWMVDALKVGPVHATISEVTDVTKDNSAYFVEERPIPSFSQQVQTDFPSENVAHEAYITRPRRLFDGSLSILDETSTWALQRDDISRMKVISQLDRKFIVCVVDATSESNGDSQASDCSKRILVLVDQHAASERVRVEGYLKTLCHHFLDAGHKESQTTFRVKLEPPHPVLLSRREVSMLRSSSQILQRWGFDLSWPEIENRDQKRRSGGSSSAQRATSGGREGTHIVFVSEWYSFFHD
jgi:DNA mismatch repair ATPase MutL